MWIIREQNIDMNKTALLGVTEAKKQTFKAKSHPFMCVCLSRTWGE